MKNIYMTPEMESYEIEIQQALLTGSDTIFINGDEDPFAAPEDSDAPFMDADALLPSL